MRILANLVGSSMLFPLHRSTDSSLLFPGFPLVAHAASEEPSSVISQLKSCLPICIREDLYNWGIWTSLYQWWNNVQWPRPSDFDASTSRIYQQQYIPPQNSVTSTEYVYRIFGQETTDIWRIIQVIVSIAGIAISAALIIHLIDQMNPTAKEKRIARKRANEIFRTLGLRQVPKLSDYEVCIAVNLVDTETLSTTWESIGGLESVIVDLQESVILPFQAAQLLRNTSTLLRPPKGVLMFGPPGCGKTMLGRAMARAAHACFINLQITNLVNMWYGETQKLVEATFTLAHKLQPCIIFVDELDSFLSTRSQLDNEATRMIKTQFMSLWDGLLTHDNNRILVVGATNRPSDLDSAILRRLPYKVYVPLPNVQQRYQILQVQLRGEPWATRLTPEQLLAIANNAAGLSGSDLHEVCREAALCRLRTLMNEGVANFSSLENLKSSADFAIRPEDFDKSLEKFRLNQHSLTPQLSTLLSVSERGVHHEPPD